jgi:hypothetical protein
MCIKPFGSHEGQHASLRYLKSGSVGKEPVSIESDFLGMCCICMRIELSLNLPMDMSFMQRLDAKELLHALDDLA